MIKNEHLREIAKICVTFLPLLVILLFFVIPLVGDINATKGSLPDFGGEALAYTFWILVLFFISFLCLVTSYLVDKDVLITRRSLLISISFGIMASIYATITTITVYASTFVRPPIFDGNPLTILSCTFLIFIIGITIYLLNKSSDKMSRLKKHVGGVILFLITFIIDVGLLYINFPIEPIVAFTLTLIFAYLGILFFNWSKFPTEIISDRNIQLAGKFVIAMVFFGAALASVTSIFYYTYFSSNATVQSTSAISSIIQSLASSMLVFSSIIIGLVGIYLGMKNVKERKKINKFYIFKNIKLKTPALIFLFQFLAIFMLIACLEFLIVEYSLSLTFLDIAILLDFASFGLIAVLFFY